MASKRILKKSTVFPLLVVGMLVAASISCTALIPSAEITLTPDVSDSSSPVLPPEDSSPSQPSSDLPSPDQSAPDLPSPEEQEPVLPPGSDKATPEAQDPEEQEPEAPSVPGVLLEDNFEDSSSGWEIGDYDGGSVGYENGSYFVEATIESSLMWGLAGKVFEDTDITVETRQVSAPGNDNNGYGIMCRVQSNDDGYILRISGDGYAGIHYFLNGDSEPLVDWFESPVINQGNSSNILRAVCNGPNFALYVNGTLVAEATDSTFSQGDIAFGSTSYEVDSTKVLFDNVRVVLPQP